MPTLPFYIVDVFAEKPYNGNQLAVFLNAADLSDEQMLQMTREVNFAESTFVTGGSAEAGYAVRIFTPEYEVPFAGHPTIGTAYVLRQAFGHPDSLPVTLNLKIGRIPVEQQEKLLWLEAVQPTFRKTYSAEELAPILNLPVESFDHNFPIEWVSTGLPYLIIPLRSLETMRTLSIESKALTHWLISHKLHKSNSDNGLTTAFYLFCPETYQPGNQLNARMLFQENDRIAEDAATGSASSCLLAYLLKHQYTGSSRAQLRLEQGYEMNRPSLIELNGNLTNNRYSLRIGGQVKLIAQGEWHIS